MSDKLLNKIVDDYDSLFDLAKNFSARVPAAKLTHNELAMGDSPTLGFEIKLPSGNKVEVCFSLVDAHKE